MPQEETKAKTMYIQYITVITFASHMPLFCESRPYSVMLMKMLPMARMKAGMKSDSVGCKKAALNASG